MNLPHGDMVGHTGDIEATFVACKAIDETVNIIFDTKEQVGSPFSFSAWMT